MGNNEDVIMVDEQLSFGASWSSFVFHKLSQIMVVIMEMLGFSQIRAYISDFIIIQQNYEQCLSAINTLLQLLRTLGSKSTTPKLRAQCKASYYHILEHHFRHI
jgi:hypothetical protein